MYMSVCFNQDTVSRAQVASQKALTIDPAEYIRCARLRQQVCPVFADVAVDEERVRQQWPSPGVPPGITEAAQAMDTLHTFAPNLDGPASMRTASCQLPREDEGDINVVADSDRQPPLSLARASTQTQLLQSRASQAKTLRSPTSLGSLWTCRRSFS